VRIFRGDEPPILIGHRGAAALAPENTLEALRAALGEVVVVAKRSTPLPELDVPVWIEPDEPRHPRAGIVHALERARGRSVLACAADLPLQRLGPVCCCQPKIRQGGGE